MDNETIHQIAHELAYGKFLNRLITDYKDIRLSDGQIYSLYQQCFNIDDFEEIIKCGATEKLP